MRRLLIITFTALAVGLSAPAAMARTASSTVVSAPNIEVGTYSYNAGGGYRVTVGFLPCGASWTFPDENGNPVTTTDPAAQYTATVKKGGAANVQVWAHDPANLDGALHSIYPFGLTQTAIDTLNADATTYTCAA